MRIYLAIFLLWINSLTGCRGQTPPVPQRNTEPVVLANHEEQPAAIGVDEANVYWVAESRSAIHRIAKTGGTITSIITGEEGIRRMIADGDFIYFLTNTQIKRVRKSGGAATTLVTFADLGSAELTYWRLAVDKDSVYFVGGPKADQLFKMSKVGDKPVSLARVFLPTNFVSDGVDIYWADFSGLEKLSLAGGKVITIGDCDKAAAVAVDSANVYCATESGRVLRFAKANGAVTTIASVENASFDQLAVDENNVYAASVINGIFRIEKAGAAQPVKLVSIDRESVNFVIDDSNLYWSRYDAGTVMRRHK